MASLVTAPTLRSILLHWSLDPTILVMVVLSASLYLGGVARLARRDPPVRWAPSRTASFLAGIATIAFATESGLARYDTVLFSLHVVQHVLLGMAAPLLLALGAPVTLALQASRRPTQTTLVRLVNHPATGIVTHPLVAWAIFGGTLFGLYFSPLFELSLRNEWVHEAVHIHFVAVGCMFAWAAVGLDPVRHRLSYPARLLFVLLAVPFHAFLGLAMLGGDGPPLGGSFYREVVRNWGSSVRVDQRTGAGVMWVVGDLFGLVAGAIVLTQWVRSDRRRQEREDRILDAVSGFDAGSRSARPEVQ